jgi:hypothetical protein
MPIADEKHSDSISSYSAPSDSNNGAGRRTFPPYRRVDGYVEVSKDNKAFRFPCYKIPGQKNVYQRWDYKGKNVSDSGRKGAFGSVCVIR